MSFLATLRSRLSGPVSAGLRAATSAMARVRGAETEHVPEAGITSPERLAADPDPLEEAHVHLARLSAALAASGDAAVAAAGARFHGAVRSLLDALSRHPAALAAHRRPLSAWVPGLASATERFVSLQRERPCSDRRDELVTVLDQVARRVQAHARAVEERQASPQAV